MAWNNSVDIPSIPGYLLLPTVLTTAFTLLSESIGYSLKVRVLQVLRPSQATSTSVVRWVKKWSLVKSSSIAQTNYSVYQRSTVIACAWKSTDTNRWYQVLGVQYSPKYNCATIRKQEYSLRSKQWANKHVIGIKLVVLNDQGIKLVNDSRKTVPILEIATWHKTISLLHPETKRKCCCFPPCFNWNGSSWAATWLPFINTSW